MNALPFTSIDWSSIEKAESKGKSEKENRKAYSEEMIQKIFALGFILAIAAFADDREPSSEDIINELKSGHSAYKPNRLILNFKPISLIVGQSVSGVPPYPMKCLQVKGRVFRDLGIQAEPVFVLGGKGGYGFTVGPGYFPSFPWDESHVTLKYEMDYINSMGAYHGLMIEMARHHLFGLFVLTYGGAVGFGVTGSTASKNDEGDIRIFEVNEGLTYDINLGVGFAL